MFFPLTPFKETSIEHKSLFAVDKANWQLVSWPYLQKKSTSNTEQP